MSNPKKAKSKKAKPKTAKTTTAVTSSDPNGDVAAVDPFSRFGFGGLHDWPAWLGRNLPDRVFGDLDGILDHIKVEEYLDGDTLVVRAELPDVDPENDIDISVEHQRLSIRAERTSKVEERKDTGLRSEFRYGSFSRVLPLPERANAEEIEASYADGILEVRVPIDKADPKTKMKVEVTRP